MALALKNRPVLNFTQPPGVTMASWSTGSGTVTDAFKPDQVPGTSAPVGMGVASQSTSDGSTPAGASGGNNGGVGMSLGGLY
jgi:penicillin-binding protein 1A